MVRNKPQGLAVQGGSGIPETRRQAEVMRDATGQKPRLVSTGSTRKTAGCADAKRALPPPP